MIHVVISGYHYMVVGYHHMVETDIVGSRTDIVGSWATLHEINSMCCSYIESKSWQIECEFARIDPVTEVTLAHDIVAR